MQSKSARRKGKTRALKSARFFQAHGVHEAETKKGARRAGKRFVKETRKITRMLTGR